MNRKIFNPKSEAGKKGFADSDGEWLIKPLYDDVDVFREGVCWVKAGDKWGLINEKGETLIEPQYEDIRQFNDGYGNVKLGGKWGVVDKAGDFIFEPQFDFMGHTMEGLTKVKADGKYGFINTKTHEIIIPVYDEVYNFSEGFAAVRLSELWGYIDKKGVEVIKPRYSWVESFLDGSASYVEEWGEIGVLDIVDGRPVLSQPVFECDNDDDEEEDEPGDEREYFGGIDRHGNYIARPVFQKISGFINGQAVVKIDGKWGLINSLGAYIVAPSPEKLTPSDDERFGEIREHPAFIKNTLPTCSDDIEFHEGLATVKVSDKWGFINTRGEMVIAPKFEFVEDFKTGTGLSIVTENGLHGVINTRGEYIVKSVYNFIEILNGGKYICVTDSGNRCGLIDSNGRMVVPPHPSYEFLSEGEDMVGYFDAETQLYGFIDGKTGLMTEPLFDEINPFKHGVAVVGFSEQQIEAGEQYKPVVFSQINRDDVC